jgi:hypothetical protein
MVNIFKEKGSIYSMQKKGGGYQNLFLEVCNKTFYKGGKQ